MMASDTYHSSLLLFIYFHYIASYLMARMMGSYVHIVMLVSTKVIKKITPLANGGVADSLDFSHIFIQVHT